MDSARSILAAYPMRPIELFFKEAYLHNPERHLDRPCAREDVADLLEGIEEYDSQVRGGTGFLTTLDESSFIEEELDCAFYVHFRYMPCFIHNHVFFEMMYVESGSCTNYIENAALDLHEGDVCILAPGVTHAVSSYQEETILINSLIRTSTFDTTFIGLLEDDSIIANFFMRALRRSEDKPYLVFHTGTDERVHSLIHAAVQEADDNRRYKKQMINNLLSSLFILLIRDHEKDMDMPAADYRAGDDNLLYIIHYMQSHYTTVTLGELASFFNYSERQLQRILKNATGMSFMENIQHQKISRARELLTGSSLSVEEICEQIGFHSENNFRRIFRRYCGLTPGEYRLQQSPSAGEQSALT